MKTYDLVIIGSGTGAQAASSPMRAAGWSVALIDHRPFGGTCALRGCDLAHASIASLHCGRDLGRNACGN